MKFYVPQFRIATLQPPQSRFVSKFGGLPWGLPLEKWARCQQCDRHMSLLAQLRHDPPALDLGGDDNILHLFQCQECLGCDAGEGNDAVILKAIELGECLTPLPVDDDLAGILESNLGQMVGELWIDGWAEQDDGLEFALATKIFDQRMWMDLPENEKLAMFDYRCRTKMGGVPYWTGNGPLHQPRNGYEFLFQLDDAIPLKGSLPVADEIGCSVIETELEGEGMEIRIVRQQCHRPDPRYKRMNAPWSINIQDAKKGEMLGSITNLGSDGTAYVFINRQTTPPRAYWFWYR